MNHNDIRDLRTMLRTSQAELARRAGVSRGTVYRIEHARSCQEATKKKVVLALGALARQRFLRGY
jgi:DNA-binding XRE family transcriptional regulator